MPQADYAHDGTYVDYTPGAAVAAGDVVVLAELVGVANSAIAANALGALCIAGVFDFNKATGVTYAYGILLYWDDTNNVVTTTVGSNKLIGKCIRAALTGDTKARVAMSQ